jgi:hypothetical protein
MVNTMSRWIMARSLGSTTTITCSIPWFRASSAVIPSNAPGLDRCDSPMITVSGRSTWTSPPSMV